MKKSCDNFLKCRNCVNWQQAWRLDRKMVICDQEEDEDGDFYHPEHKACEFFVPLQGALPPEIQKLRLFTQTLTETEASYLEWSLKQRRQILKVKDAKGDFLSQGDYVVFRYQIHNYVGSVEAVDNENRDAVMINCPAFTNGSISLLGSTVTKLSLAEAREKIREALPETLATDLQWQVECLTDEICILRSKGLENLSEIERDSLLECEMKLSEKEAQLKFNTHLFNKK
jgi:hypothetical protein